MSNRKKSRLRPRERDAILQSLRAGVTPRNGLQHIQVGRVKEVKALLEDIERIIDGGSAFRLVIGEFGSGKSFFMQLVRTIALERGLVTIHADLSPDRRLQGTGGQARKLYAELMRNLSTRTKPDGNGVASVVERYLTESRSVANLSGETVRMVIEKRLNELSEFVSGYDFALVIASYWKAHKEGNEHLKQNVMRWLRGEYLAKTDARKALGVRSIITDADVYDQLKLLSLFVRQAGYKGLLVIVDEMVNLYKLSSKTARASNYEQLLRMLNDCLQGSAEHVGFLFGGTPEFLFDPRKGLYSYEALQSRLAENIFAKEAGIIDYTSPTLHLASLQPEELYVLLENLRHVYASGNPKKYLVPDEALMAFLKHCSKRIGDAYFKTPRNTIKAFVDFLAVLDQSDHLKWDQLIERVDLKKEVDTDMPQVDSENETEEELATFQL